MCLGIPGKIIEINVVNGMRMGKVDFGGVLREACLDALPEAKIGDYTIVHAGFGLSILDETEAQETLDILRELVSSMEDDDPGDIGTYENFFGTK